MPAVAVDAIRLLMRAWLRSEPIRSSSAAALAAGAGPCSASSRKTKTSPTMIECLVRGISIGNAAASATTSIQQTICTSSGIGRRAIWTNEAASASAPAALKATQKRVAAGL